ncbi:MAG: sulfatase [Planctomycetes bacterium]|nr:sulfatase [Planctomycetota bacterium]
MHRVLHVLTTVLCLVTPFTAGAARGADVPRRPNIVVIVADDLGYADLGFQGGRDVPTPHLDALAATGVRCTSGYVSGPYCSPTRAGLLTGRYQQRFGHEFNPGPPGPDTLEIGLPLTETTLADRLGKAGYATGLVGKWHLGNGPNHQPQSRGFAEFFGFLGGAHGYGPFPDGDKGPNAIRRGREPVAENEYLTDAFAREAVAFIDRHAAAPFFLMLTFNAVHTPMEARAGSEARFAGVTPPRRRTYAAMLAAMDDAVGKVTAALAERKLTGDTVVFFISDNGGPPVNASSNGTLRGHKATTWEGGVRVPFVVSWPGTLPAGKTYDEPVIQLDIAPTALAAAGIARPDGLDGVDLRPFLTGDRGGAPHDALYWRFGQQRAIRMGNWKLVDATGGTGPMLVDLAADLGEQTDKSTAEPQARQRLEEAWKTWNATLQEPRWGRGNPARQRQRQQQRQRQPQGGRQTVPPATASDR